MSLNRKEADGTYTEVAGVPYVTKENIGLGKVENKSPEELVAMSMEASGYVSVLEYGDSEDFDIGEALNAAIADDTINKIFIPKGNYKSSESVVITRPVKIIGEGSWYREVTGEPLHPNTPFIEFESEKGFDIKVPNVEIERVAVKAKEYGFFAEYYKEDGKIHSIFNITIKDCYSENASKSNFYFGMTVQCYFEHCIAVGGYRGFSFEGGQNTSSMIINCWVRNCQNHGYYLSGMTYCTIENCCCDITNTFGFVLSACRSVTLIGCGTEIAKNGLAQISNCNGITLIEPFGAMNGTESRVEGTIAYIYASNNVTIIGGKNVDALGANDITIHANSDKPTLLSCDGLRLNFRRDSEIETEKLNSIETGYARFSLVYRGNVTITNENEGVDVNLVVATESMNRTSMLYAVVTSQSTTKNYIYSALFDKPNKKMRFNANVAQVYSVEVYLLEKMIEST